MRIHNIVSFLVCVATPWGMTAVAAPTYRFDLAPAPLTASVAKIATLAHVSIATSDPELLAGTARPFHITGTVREALSELLKDTHAEAIPIGRTGWRIVRRRPRSTPNLEPLLAAKPEPDIIVTGSKRDRFLSNYPGSVSIIGGTQLSRFAAAPDTDALARISPTLQSTHLGPGRNKLFLRGIADSSFNGSGAALVGIYINDLRLNYNAPDPALRLYDIDRVEILEGPQSTLYGAGSIAGLVRITPRPPDPAAASGEAWTAGALTSHGSAGGEFGAIVNMPLVSDRVALRIVAYAARDGGYIDDVERDRRDVNRTGTIGGRGTIRANLADSWTLDLSGITQRIRNRDAQYAERDQSELTRSSIAAQPSSNLFRAGYGVLSGRIGSMNVSSTTGIVGQSLQQIFIPDDGNHETIYHQHDVIRLLTEELRLSSLPDARLGWVAGVSALQSRTATSATISSDSLDRSLSRMHTKLTDLTAFGEVTIPLSPAISLTAGGRISNVRLDGRAVSSRLATGLIEPPTTSGTRHEHFAVPSLALSWVPQTGWLGFVRYSQGYRPGGQTASGIIQRYDADRLSSLESAVRATSMAGGRLSGQFSLAISRWSKVQADALGADGIPFTQNIGDGRVRSITGSIDWAPAPDLQLKLAGALARGHVKMKDTANVTTVRTPLPNVARDTLAGSIDWHHDLGDEHRLSARLSANHVGRSVLGSGVELSKITQGGYWLVSGGVELETHREAISLDFDNLLDTAANSFAFGAPTYRFDSNEQTPLRPRTLRIGLHHSF